MKKLEEVHTPYNRVEIWQNNAGRIDFEVSGATHATWHPGKLLTGHAWDAITAATVSHPGPVNSILLLGLGGGTCLRQLRTLLPDTSMTAVEIDSVMIELAAKYMQTDQLNLDILEADAFHYLTEGDLKVDVIIDDLYHARGMDVERPKAITPDYLEKVTHHLKPGGSVVMNFVVGPGHDEVFQQACSAFRSVFGQTRRLIPPLSYNEVLVGTTHRKPLVRTRDLHRKADAFTTSEDQDFWKELRSLKLR